MHFINLKLINGAMVTLNVAHIIQIMPREKTQCVIITPKEQLTAEVPYEKILIELEVNELK
jgi:hypothetical protein